MVGAVPTAVRFCCPECGTGLRALCADATSVIDCHRCGVRVRVPRKPHPVETDTAAPLVALGDDGREARSATKLLLLDVNFLAYEIIFVLSALGLWIYSVGIDRVLERDAGAGSDRWVMFAFWLFVLVIDSVRGLIRWTAYDSWEPAALVFSAKIWLSTAKIGVILRTLGLWLAMLPVLCAYSTSDTPIVLRAIAEIGFLAWVVGRVFEFGVSFTWFRVLQDLSGPTAARSVARYIATAVGALVVLAMAACLASIAVVLALRKAEPPVQIKISELPLPAAIAVGGVLVLFATFSCILFFQYARVLVLLRKTLTSSLHTEAQ